MKNLIKRALKYVPMVETTPVRDILAANRIEGHPYCPDWEGDLMFTLIRRNGYASCVETGFGTGSTALYMLEASAPNGGVVTSIDWSDQQFNSVGKDVIARSGYGDRHTLIEEDSYKVFPRFLADEKPIDFAFFDGRKTFDYLAYELFIVNRLMPVGGAVMFDDSYLPSVGKTVDYLKTHFGFEEIDYEAYGQSKTLRLYHILTCRSAVRPYRVLIKTLPVEKQPVHNVTFFQSF